MMEWLQGQALLGTEGDVCRALDMFAGSCAPWTVELQGEGE